MTIKHNKNIEIIKITFIKCKNKRIIQFYCCRNHHVKFETDSNIYKDIRLDIR